MLTDFEKIVLKYIKFKLLKVYHCAEDKYEKKYGEKVAQVIYNLRNEIVDEIDDMEL